MMGTGIFLAPISVGAVAVWVIGTVIAIGGMIWFFERLKKNNI